MQVRPVALCQSGIILHFELLFWVTNLPCFSVVIQWGVASSALPSNHCNCSPFSILKRDLRSLRWSERGFLMRVLCVVDFIDIHHLKEIYILGHSCWNMLLSCILQNMLWLPCMTRSTLQHSRILRMKTPHDCDIRTKPMEHLLRPKRHLVLFA